MNTPTIDQLKRALEISEKIAALEADMNSIFGGHTVEPTPVFTNAPAPKPEIKSSAPASKKGRMSPEGRAPIAAAQKARWAKTNSAKPASSPIPAPAASPSKGGMSPEHKAKLAASAKKRWAKIKAGKAPSPFAAKK